MENIRNNFPSSAWKGKPKPWMKGVATHILSASNNDTNLRNMPPRLADSPTHAALLILHGGSRAWEGVAMMRRLLR